MNFGLSFHSRLYLYELAAFLQVYLKLNHGNYTLNEELQCSPLKTAKVHGWGLWKESEKQAPNVVWFCSCVLPGALQLPPHMLKHVLHGGMIPGPGVARLHLNSFENKDCVSTEKLRRYQPSRQPLDKHFRSRNYKPNHIQWYQS